MNPYAAVHAVAAYAYSSSPLKLAEALFPGQHPGYLSEWADRFVSGLPRAIGYMDENTFRRFVDLAIEDCGEHALARYPGRVEP